MSCCPDDTDSTDDQKPYIRECTDVFWLCIFLGFWICMILVASFAFVYGNPLRLTNGYDSFGNVCDSDDNYEYQLADFNFSVTETTDKKYLFFMDYENTRQSLQICVKQCPDRDMFSLNDIEDFYKRTGSLLCRYGSDFKFLREANFPINSSFGPCPTLPVYKSSPILNRCVPDVAKDVGIYFLNESWNFVEELVGDLYRTWRWILWLTLISVVLSMIVVSLLHLFASVVSWIIMVSVCAVCVVVTGVLWWTYFDIKCQLDNRESGQWLNEEVDNEEVFKIYSVVATIVTLIILLLVFVMRKKITFLAALFQEASNCLADLPCLYLQPIISFLLLMAFYAYWISVVVCLATASYVESKRFVPSSTRIASMKNETTDFPSSSNLSVDDLTGFTAVEYVESTWLKYMLLLYFVGLIWVSEFILACQHMVVAGTVAKWYFNSKNGKNSASMVMTSIGTVILYHLGSAAFGSFLITLLKLPRIIFTYLQNKFRKNKDESQCAEYGLKCCSCCFYALEKCLRFMNHNAYTVVAVQGINFCPAAYRAWKVLANNALRLATINSVGDFILFLGKCFVAMIMTVIAVLIFKFDSSLKFYAGPTMIVFIFSYFVSHTVISLYELVIDTLFLCICEDLEMNGNDGQWKTTLLASIEYKGVKRCPPPQPTEL
ncbi:choline transporter-like 1 [Planococcus citri]|uniref:choline transporter-like 1 n=1 Tax=Planococcus citri TaxID=170843 RepID=UPI0031F77246